MPFIRTVHFVVSNIEQVPDWLDQSKVHVVLHEDIIPEQLLPTYNSTTIEMFLCKIPDLAEQFIYSNDDTFADNLMSPLHFFTQDGLPRHRMVRHNGVVRNVFLMQCKNSWRFARRLTNAQSSISDSFLQIRHSMTPMLKSIYEEVHSLGGAEIIDKCTKFREPWNFNQYLFPDYAYLTKRASNSEMVAFKYH